MLESGTASGSTDVQHPVKPDDDCRVCGGVVEHVRTDQQTKYQVEHYRCKGDCRGGGHRVRDGDELVNVGGPVFEGRSFGLVEVFDGP